MLYALYIFENTPKYNVVYVECPDNSIQQYPNLSEFNKQIFVCGEVQQVPLNVIQDRFIKDETNNYLNGIE